jgi:hypothetical protein
MEGVFERIPEHGGLEGGLDEVLELWPNVDAVDAWAEGDVVEDGEWEGVWALEDHSDAFTEEAEVAIVAVDILAIEEDLAGDVDAWDAFVEAVEAA